MPAIYPLSRSFGLTPPEAYDEYCCPPSATMYASYNASDIRRAYEAHDPYGAYAKHTLPMRDVQVEHAPSAIAGFSSALDQRREKVPSHMPAPILPPIRVPDVITNASQAAHAYSNHHSVASRAPENDTGKVSGGVAAHLDYEMEHMVDFVAESAQGMYDLLVTRLYLADVDLSRSVQSGGNHNSGAAPPFRKYVASILSSTRLPSSTVVLALHYLATRMTILSARGSSPKITDSDNTTGNGNGGSPLYHLLTTALMLASKFLDDNTFQNRSWADVSQIPVAQLNRHELAWLADVHWSLHFDPRDTRGFAAWIQQWRKCQARRVTEDTRRAEETAAVAAARSSVESLTLTPAVEPYATKTQRPHGFIPPPTPAYTPFGPETLTMPPWSNFDRQSPSTWGQWPRVQRDTPPQSAWSQWPQSARRETVSPKWADWAMSRKLTPPSAGHSGSATPEYYNGGRSAASYAQQPASHYSSRPLPPPANLLSSHSPFDAQYAPFHTPGWGGPNLGHGLGCGCGYCVHHDRYMGGHGYGMQTVVG